MAKTSFPKEKIKILLLEDIHPVAVSLFKEAGYKEIEILKSSLAENELKKKVADVHLLGIRSKTQLTKNVLDSAKKLIASGAFCIGTNQVDLTSATNHGIAVFNSPYSNTRSVAELVIGFAIMLMRQIPLKSEAAQKGEWLKDSEGCFEVRGKTLGIIGYGHIGSQVSVLAESIGMRVIFYDVIPKLSLGNAKQVKTMDELLKKSDIVSLHVPGNNLSRNLISEKQMSLMKKGAVLINLSRGDVIDADALKKMAMQKHIAGAAIDVFKDEPKGKKDKFISVLQNLPNVILTPHIGGSTQEAQQNIGEDVAQKLINFLETGSSVGSLTVPQLNLPTIKDTHRLLHIHKNVPGILKEINAILSDMNTNILGQYLVTNESIGYVVLDVDKKTPEDVIDKLRSVKDTIRVRTLY